MGGSERVVKSIRSGVSSERAPQPVRINALDGERMVRDSDSMFDRMYQQIMCILALNTREQVLTWQYILVSYCHLEALALELLRLQQGADEQTFWEGPDARKNLNGVATELKPFVPPEII
jgi:hypothetical protein